MSDDKAALIRACLINPADDLPRLVLADYLEERGDYARAYHLRRSRNTWFYPERYDKLDERTRSVIDGILDGWSGVGINRGFVYHVECDCEWFSRHAEALFRHSPVTSVVLTDCEPLSTNSEEFEPPPERHIYIWVIRSPGSKMSWEVPRELWCGDLVEWQSSEDKAHAALSAACVDFGRRLAGLPALERTNTQEVTT